MAENIIEIEKVQQAAARDEFWAYRGHAIQAYANLEQSLCSLLTTLLETDRSIASIVFYKIVNTHSRNTILTELLEAKHQEKYYTFWHGEKGKPSKGILSHINEMDSIRNRIIHWHSVLNIGASETDYLITLAHPTSPFSKETLEKTTLGHFIEKAGSLSRLCNIFSIYLAGEMPESVVPTWLDIFSQPVVYPLPSTHPLILTDKAPQSPPQS